MIDLWILFMRLFLTTKKNKNKNKKKGDYRKTCSFLLVGLSFVSLFPFSRCWFPSNFQVIVQTSVQNRVVRIFSLLFVQKRGLSEEWKYFWAAKMFFFSLQTKFKHYAVEFICKITDRKERRLPFFSIRRFRHHMKCKLLNITENEETSLWRVSYHVLSDVV